MNKTKIEWCDMIWNLVWGCKNKIIPQRKWIKELINIDIPLFMKDNLRPHWKRRFRLDRNFRNEIRFIYIIKIL